MKEEHTGEFMSHKPALFVYKCRMCGAEFIEAHGEGTLWGHDLPVCVRKVVDNIAPEKSTHVHNAESFGVADLIGARNIKPEEVERWML